MYCTCRIELAASFPQGPAEAVKNAEKILCSRLKHINAIFKILIDERFEENSLKLSDLLEWKLWPCLIKHFGGKDFLLASSLGSLCMLESLVYFLT